MSFSPWRCLQHGGLTLVVLTLLSGACASQQPEAQLIRALKSTLGTSFAYEFALQADQEALPGLGPEREQARLLFQGLNITGHRSDERHSFAVRALGIDAFELRTLDEDTLYLRFGFDELARMLGEGDSSAQIVPLLRQRGLSDEAIAAVAAAFRGEWVGVEGHVKAAELRAVLGSEGDAEPARSADSESWREALGGDVEGFVERYVVVNAVSGSDDERVFEVGLRARDLFRAVAGVDPTSQVQDIEAGLEGLPELAPGTVTARDGVVTNVVVDLAEAPAPAEQVNGTGSLRLDVSQHGKVGDVEPPPGVVVVTDEQFLEALAAVSGLVEDLTPPAPAR
ncbi:MAG: hypothetical protein M3O70_11495 [Actinomycetota bacterium]|nr:hypothetical protein [Actinomycetota bacterium]